MKLFILICVVYLSALVTSQPSVPNRPFQTPETDRQSLAEQNQNFAESWGTRERDFLTESEEESDPSARDNVNEENENSEEGDHQDTSSEKLVRRRRYSKSPLPNVAFSQQGFPGNGQSIVDSVSHNAAIPFANGGATGKGPTLNKIPIKMPDVGIKSHLDQAKRGVDVNINGFPIEAQGVGISSGINKINQFSDTVVSPINHDQQGLGINSGINKINQFPGLLGSSINHDQQGLGISSGTNKFNQFPGVAGSHINVAQQGLGTNKFNQFSRPHIDHTKQGLGINSGTNKFNKFSGVSGPHIDQTKQGLGMNGVPNAFPINNSPLGVGTQFGQCRK